MITTIVGAQFGDEGKGRVVDYLARHADLVIRFQGGDNAGHTVVNDTGLFQLHLIPSGIFYPETICLLGSGVVVNPTSLLEELAEVEAKGIDTSNLKISNRAQMIMPYHPALDGLEEASRAGKEIGTTKRGIGPAYSDKAARRGLRIGDLMHPEWLRQRLELVLPATNHKLAYFGAETMEVDALMAQCAEWAEALNGRIVEPLPIVKHAVKTGQNVLLEGQLGVMRDLDWGTYPYVTSSNPTAAFAAVGAGLPPQEIDKVIGVAKAYATAVGAGPYPAELTDEVGQKMRDIGHEYGATTGRPRRTGWHDVVAVRHAAWLNGFTGLAITKMDVLDDFPELKICTGYRLPDGREIDYVPDTPILKTVEPIYESWPGWETPTTAVRSWDDLPVNAQKYLERLQELNGVPIQFVSVGAHREAMFAV